MWNYEEIRSEWMFKRGKCLNLSSWNGFSIDSFWLIDILNAIMWFLTLFCMQMNIKTNNFSWLRRFVLQICFQSCVDFIPVCILKNFQYHQKKIRSHKKCISRMNGNSRLLTTLRNERNSKCVRIIVNCVINLFIIACVLRNNTC